MSEIIIWKCTHCRRTWYEHPLWPESVADGNRIRKGDETDQICDACKIGRMYMVRRNDGRTDEV